MPVETPVPSVSQCVKAPDVLWSVVSVHWGLSRHHSGPAFLCAGQNGAPRSEHSPLFADT